MTPDQHKLFLEEMKQEIRYTVNGKIDSLSRDFKQYVKDDMAWKDDYTESDLEWKDKAQPAIDAFSNLTGAGKILVALALAASAIIGFLIAIKTYFHI